MTEKIYEDPYVYVVLPDQPAVHGHIQVFSKKEVKTLDELSHDEVQHMFQVGSRAATVLFETLGAHGTNIMINEGTLFNQHVHLDVIARKPEDGINTKWDPKELPDSDQVLSSIKSHTVVHEHKAENEKHESHHIRKDIPVITGDEGGSYLTRRLKKLP